ncbi:metal-dependent hydrolase [Wenjunlia tyrosinilytica]|uniref:Membrane protein n=1 Tax=Wenjunlia tyrosinilytica TaxID=1544741 RepID=A0A918E0B5_9ACTN|nr:metal-dependent hydrolase [Wenjunlia tyrosinilytica]GGO98027.1 membrane protein [Wenjunlia tyrosinilytica]
MMGRSHITLTALAWLAAAPPLAAHFGRPMETATAAASTVVAASASLWPDWDHPRATMAHTLGPVSRGIARTVAKAARGHRHGTHTLLFCVGTGAAATLLAHLPSNVAGVALPPNWGALLLLLFLAYTLMMTMGIAVSKNTGLGDGIYALQAVAFTVACALFVPGHWWWVPWAVGAGCLLHCVQDMLTTGGLPWFWRPFSRARAHMPVCGETGGMGEMTVSAVGLGVLLWVGLAVATRHTWWSVSWLSRW